MIKSSSNQALAMEQNRAAWSVTKKMQLPWMMGGELH